MSDHVQIELQRLTNTLTEQTEELGYLKAALDAHERHLEHLIDVVRAAERLYEVLTGPVVIINDTIETATRNLGDALKALHQ